MPTTSKKADGGGGGGGTWLKLELLLLLYLVQGLPFGLQVKTLPILLRQEGVSLSAISFLGILSLPWLFKLAWAPLVDSYYSPKIGKRKSWILPCLLIMGWYDELEMKSPREEKESSREQRTGSR